MPIDLGKEHPWWQSGVIYQIYPRSFTDSDGDGIGDLPGIIGRLDYLRWLGVDAIWLSPIFPSPMADFGYDVANYTDIDPTFGTLADLDALVNAAHTRGIRVLLDFVPNHTSSQHSWFMESRASRTHPRRNWYIWRDARADGIPPDGGPPNGWQSAFGGSAWEWDELTGQYYFHSFLKEQPDLDWTNPQVREAMAEVLRFWFRRGIDGFRLDVVNLIAKRHELEPATAPAPAKQVWGDERRIQPLIAGIRRVTDEFDDRVLVGELWLPLKKLVRYYGEGLSGLHLPFNFQLLLLPWSAGRIRKAIERYEGLLPAGAWPNWVLGNHDKPRIASRVGSAQARVAQMLLLTLRGTPTLYYGDEIGMRDVDIPADRQRDPGRFGPAGGRDPQRTPMRWNGTRNAGFTTGTPWLPIGDDVESVNVAAQKADERSMLHLTRRLLALRRAEPALAVGDWVPLPADGQLVAFERRAGDGRCVGVFLNLSDRPLSADLGSLGNGRILLSTELDRAGGVGDSLELRPNEGVVIELISRE